MWKPFKVLAQKKQNNLDVGINGGEDKLTVHPERPVMDLVHLQGGRVPVEQARAEKHDAVGVRRT